MPRIRIKLRSTEAQKTFPTTHDTDARDNGGKSWPGSNIHTLSSRLVREILYYLFPASPEVFIGGKEEKNVVVCSREPGKLRRLHGGARRERERESAATWCNRDEGVTGTRARWRKINLRFPCRATCNFKGCSGGVKSVKRRGAPPPRDKSVRIHTVRGRRYVPRGSDALLSPRTPDRHLCVRVPVSHVAILQRWRIPAAVIFSFYVYAWCASGASIFINLRMDVCIFIRRLDRLRQRGARMGKKRRIRVAQSFVSWSLESTTLGSGCASACRFARESSLLPCQSTWSHHGKCSERDALLLRKVIFLGTVVFEEIHFHAFILQRRRIENIYLYTLISSHNTYFFPPLHVPSLDYLNFPFRHKLGETGPSAFIMNSLSTFKTCKWDTCWSHRPCTNGVSWSLTLLGSSCTAPLNREITTNNKPLSLLLGISRGSTTYRSTPHECLTHSASVPSTVFCQKNPIILNMRA